MRAIIFSLLVVVLLVSGCADDSSSSTTTDNSQQNTVDETLIINDMQTDGSIDDDTTDDGTSDELVDEDVMVVDMADGSEIELSVGSSATIDGKELKLISHERDKPIDLSFGEKSFKLFDLNNYYPIDGWKFTFTKERVDNVHPEQDFVRILAEKYELDENEYLMKIGDLVIINGAEVSVYEIEGKSTNQDATVYVNLDVDNLNHSLDRTYTVPEGLTKDFVWDIKVTTLQVYPYDNNKDKEALLRIESV